MLVADRNELEMQLKRHATQIREKELISFTENFSVLSTQAVFLIGLGYGGLAMTPVWNSDEVFLLQYLFYTSITIAIGFNVLTMCITSWSMIFGPGLGIRGPPGSMKRAVLGMYSERNWAMQFYWAGLAFMMLGGIFLSWIKFSCLFRKTSSWGGTCYITPTLMTITFLGFGIWVTRHIVMVTRPRLHFVDTKERRADLMKFGDYDPEHGSTYGAKEVAAVPSDIIHEDEHKAISRGIERIEWLLQQGLVSAEEAKAQKSAIVQKFAMAAEGTHYRGEDKDGRDLKQGACVSTETHKSGPAMLKRSRNQNHGEIVPDTTSYSGAAQGNDNGKGNTFFPALPRA